tara:strand:+ start:198 stop:500 length:303 start_codon:yes stop_codon:yes gene_type:complete
VDVKADAPTRSNSHKDKIWNRLTLREIEIGGIGPLTEGVLIVEHIALALRAWTNCDESVTGGVNRSDVEQHGGNPVVGNTSSSGNDKLVVEFLFGPKVVV